MLEFLQSNLTVWLGALLAIAVFGLRSVTQDRKLRQDLYGAIALLIAFIGIRFLSWALGSWFSPGVTKIAHVSSMLAFAFAIIRTGVAIALWIVRLRAYPTPKILRDVIDGTLYGFVSIVILKSELDIDVTGIVATSAVLSVVIGLALQDTLGNLFAGISIQLERPFHVGDTVTIRDITGKVVQIAWRATRLETGRREVITLPNSVLSKEAVKNYSRGAEPIGVDLEYRAPLTTAPNRVKDLLLEVVRNVPMVLAKPAPQIRTVSYGDSWICYRVRYFVSNFGQSDEVSDAINSQVWYRFRRSGIEFPNPQLQLRVQRKPNGLPEVPAEKMQQMLASVDLFSLVSSAERRGLAADLVPKWFGKRERIIRQGDSGDTFYIIASGEVTVRVGEAQMLVARLGVGQYFGEMALLTGEPRTADVIAETDLLLLELNRESFRRLFAESPGLATHMSSLLAERRTQLRAVATTTTTTASESTDRARDQGHILARLRNMFALHD